MTQQQFSWWGMLPTSGHSATAAVPDESVAFLSAATAITHQLVINACCLLVLMEQYLSDHLAGEILSNRCTLCRNLVFIFSYKLPLLAKDSLTTLRTGAKGVASRAVEQILCAVTVNAPFSWVCYCMADELLVGCFILQAWAESDLHNYVFCSYDPVITYIFTCKASVSLKVVQPLNLQRQHRRFKSKMGRLSAWRQ